MFLLHPENWQKIEMLDRLNAHDEIWSVETDHAEGEDYHTAVAICSCGDIVEIAEVEKVTK